MNVFMTGVNGFIGESVVNHLAGTNHLIGCGRQDYGSSCLDGYYKWDIADDKVPVGLDEQDIDIVIHAASSKIIDDFDKELSISNIVGTQNIIKLCYEKKIKKAILFSSLPVVRPSGRNPISENDQYDPSTMYHVTKATQEMMFQQLRKYGIKVVVLRIPSPIAPIMPYRTIFTIFGEAALNNEPIYINGGGSRKQNYIDTRDIAQICEKLIDSDEADGIYNVGSEVSISNTDLAKKWIKHTGSSSEIIFTEKQDPSDDEDWIADISRLKRDITYQQQYDIDRTIEDYIQEKRKVVKTM